MRPSRRIALPLLLLPCALQPLLSACASPGYTYVAPPGISQKMLDADRSACEEESGIVRLGEDQVVLAQQCMMTRGYTMKKTP